MTALDRIDAGTRGVLERYHFDEELFERLRADVAAERLSPQSNLVGGRIEPLGADAFLDLADATDEVRDAGAEAFRRGEVAVAVLNGGMATRFGGVVKGIVDAHGGRSFLEWKALQVDRLARELGAEIPFAVMNSFATDDATRAFVRERALRDPLFFVQSVLLRLNPDGSLFLDPDGTASPYSPGHGDFAPSLRRTGTLAALRERGVRLIALSNVDNLGARPDPRVVGAHIRSGARMTSEVATKDPGDAGGSPVLVDGKPFVVEGPRFPPGFDQDSVDVFNTNTFVFDLDVFDDDYPLTWLYIEKEVSARPAVQLEQLVNEISRFVPTAYLRVPRRGRESRFLPIKRPADLEAAQPQLAQILA